MKLPTKYFLTTGVGFASSPILSFAMALEDAGLGKFNIMKVTSVLPPGCKQITKEEGLKLLHPGEIIPAIIARFVSNVSGTIISSAIGVVVPKDKTRVGYFFEHGGNKEGKIIGKEAEELALKYFSLLNIEIGESFNIYKESIVREYTTVLSLAVLL